MARGTLKTRFLTLIVGCSALFGAGMAHALTIGFDDDSDGTFELTVTDGGAGDTDGAANGQVNVGLTAIGGTPWTVSATGTGMSLLGDGELTLNSLDLSTSDVAANITVAVWDTSSGAIPQPTFNGTANASSLGGNIDPVVFSQFNAGGAPGGAAISSASGGPLNLTSDDVEENFANNAAGAFDLSIAVRVNHPAGQGTSTSFDAAITPTPLPAAAWLMGSALVLLAGIGRRASKRNARSFGT